MPQLRDASIKDSMPVQLHYKHKEISRPVRMNKAGHFPK